MPDFIGRVTDTESECPSRVGTCRGDEVVRAIAIRVGDIVHGGEHAVGIEVLIRVNAVHHADVADRAGGLVQGLERNLDHLVCIVPDLGLQDAESACLELIERDVGAAGGEVLLIGDREIGHLGSGGGVVGVAGAPDVVLDDEDLPRRARVGDLCPGAGRAVTDLETTGVAAPVPRARVVVVGLNVVTGDVLAAERDRSQRQRAGKQSETDVHWHLRIQSRRIVSSGQAGVNEYSALRNDFADRC